jgi:hypothetical protein
VLLLEQFLEQHMCVLAVWCWAQQRQQPLMLLYH